MRKPPAVRNFSHTEFVLFGFPGLQESRALLFVPFFCLYLINLVANCTVIYIIQVEESLHSPMYFLVSFLSAVGLCGGSTVLPHMLGSFLLHPYHISLSICLLQMFFIYLMIILDSSILLAMALDRYVAICNPLRYKDIMTKCLLAGLSLVAFVRALSVVCPMVFLASSLSFCCSNIIRLFAREHMALVSLACGSTIRNSLMGLAVAALIIIFDTACILVSYARIVHAALKIAASDLWQKAFQTCGTQLLVMLFMYASCLSSSIVYRVGRSVSQDVHNLLSAIYLLLPSTINPIIYGIGTHEIRQRVHRALWRRPVGHAQVSFVHSKE